MGYQIAQPVAVRPVAARKSLRASAGRDGKGTPDKRQRTRNYPVHDLTRPQLAHLLRAEAAWLGSSCKEHTNIRFGPPRPSSRSFESDPSLMLTQDFRASNLVSLSPP